MDTRSQKATLLYIYAALPLRGVHPVQIQKQHPRLQAVAMQKEMPAQIVATKSLQMEEEMMITQELAVLVLGQLLNLKALLWALNS